MCKFVDLAVKKESLSSSSILETVETPTASVIRCRYPAWTKEKEMARDGTNQRRRQGFAINGNEVVGNHH